MSGLERHLNPYPPETHTTQGEPSHRRHRHGDRHGGTIRGTSVGLPITANDRNGHALTYTLPGQDPDHSVVQEPGQVDTRHPLNYEARNTYTVRVLTVTAGAKPKWTFGSLTRTSPRIRQTAPPPQPHQAALPAAVQLDHPGPPGSPPDRSYDLRYSPTREEWTTINSLLVLQRRLV